MWHNSLEFTEIMKGYFIVIHNPMLLVLGFSMQKLIADQNVDSSAPHFHSHVNSSLSCDVEHL